MLRPAAEMAMSFCFPDDGGGGSFSDLESFHFAALMNDVQEHPLYKQSLQCPTEELHLRGESMCLATRAAGLCALRSGRHASGRLVRMCAERRAWAALGC